MGYLAESNADLPLIRGLVARLRAFLFRTFGIGGKHLSHADMVALAKASARRATHGRRNAESSTNQAEPAF